MKAALLFSIFIIFCKCALANGNYSDWRWRNNDGTEKSATWKAPLDTAITITNLNPIRLRIHFLEAGDYVLQYSTTPGPGNFVTVKQDAPENTDAFVFAGDNQYVKNGQPTTQQIPTIISGDNFVPGLMVTQTDTATRIITPSSVEPETEIEWVIKPGKYVQPGTTYYFTSNNMQVNNINAGGPSFAVLTTSKTITHATLSNDKITSYSFHPHDHLVTVDFTTSEKGLDHYVLQWSPDSLNWGDLQTVKGNSTSSSFQTDIACPPKGTYFGRIVLFDLNKNLSVSPVIKQVIAPSAVISSFTGIQDGTKLKFSFSTSSEFLEEQFVLQKYLGEALFVNVDTIGGSGTVNKTSNYTIYDDAPRAGQTIYNIVYLKNNSRYPSDNFIATYTPPPGKTAPSNGAVVLNVYPNPANTNLSFDLKGYKGKTFTVTVTSLYGKQLLKQIVDVNAAEHYSLPTAASSATYILNINGDGLAKSSRVIVQ